MYNILLSYWLRSRRTPVRLITFLCPILFSLIYGIYSMNSKGLIGKEMGMFFCTYIILANFMLKFEYDIKNIRLERNKCGCTSFKNFL